MTALNRFGFLDSERQWKATLEQKECGFDFACSSKKKQKRTGYVMDCKRS